MTTTETHNTANPYEARFGYARAVRKGPFIFVSGTTSVDPATGEVLHPASAYRQAVQVFAEIARAVEALRGTRGDVVRVRMFVREEADAEDVGRALREAFSEHGHGHGHGHGLAATMILGARFVAPEMRVEIEADALVM